MVVKYDREREGVVTFPRETHKVVFLESYDHHPEPHVVNKKIWLLGGHIEDPPGVWGKGSNATYTQESHQIPAHVT